MCYIKLNQVPYFNRRKTQKDSNSLTYLWGHHTEHPVNQLQSVVIKRQSVACYEVEHTLMCSVKQQRIAACSSDSCTS